MQVPFERIGMDLIGPLERSARGHRFALVLVDYATRYPEAVALRNISAKSVAEALFSMISRVGIPKEILTDQGTAFMSRTIRELYELLGIKSIRTSVYHPQTDGLVERFNRTLKTMIRKFVHEDAKNWDKWLEPLLFAVREVPQASTGFSPFELLYGRQPRGVLDVLRETWEEGPSESKNEIQHVLDLRTKLHTLGQLSMENLLQAQDKQSRLYNRGARLRNVTPGDKVLVLLPTSSSKLLAKWQGPFEVTRQVGDLNYEVIRTDRSGGRQIYHLNLLKKWNEVEPVMLATVVGNEEDLGPEASPKVPPLTLAPGGDHLSPSQLTDVARLQREFADLFSPRPGRTNLIQHHIETEPGVVVRSRPYRLPEHKKKVVQSELEAMLEMGVIEESRSDWASPIVLVPKTDGSVRFCVDYRKVNASLLRLVQGRPARRWRSQRVCFLPGEIPCGCRARWFWLLSLREHQSRLSAHAHRFLFRERSRPSRPPVFFLSGTCEEKTAGQRFSAPGWKRAHAGSDPACLVFTTQRFLPSFLSNLTSVPPQAWAIWSRLGGSDDELADDSMSLVASDAEELWGSVTDPAPSGLPAPSAAKAGMDAELFRVLSKAVEELGLEWSPPEEPSRSRLDEWFLLGRRQAPQQRPSPFFPEVHDELMRSWHSPYSARLRTSTSSALTTVDGAEEKGYERMPQLDESVAAHLCPPTAIGWKAKASHPFKPCRTTSALAGRSYASAGQAASALHSMAVLRVYQAKLLSAVDESEPDPATLRELRSATDLALRATKTTAQAIGRSMASLVVLERHLWLTLTEIKDADRVSFLDAPISPSGLFGPAVKGFAERFTEA